jgi:hypothetical protein
MASSVEEFSEFEYDKIHNCFVGYVTNVKERGCERRILAYCPFCGTKLPDFSYEYADAIKKVLKVDYTKIDFKDIPCEFQTDEWWKKRGITKGYLNEIYNPMRLEENIEIINGERVLKIG